MFEWLECHYRWSSNDWNVTLGSSSEDLRGPLKILWKLFAPIVHVNTHTVTHGSDDIYPFDSRQPLMMKHIDWEIGYLFRTSWKHPTNIVRFTRSPAQEIAGLGTHDWRHRYTNLFGLTPSPAMGATGVFTSASHSAESAFSPITTCNADGHSTIDGSSYF